jgi:hypothetical protein
MQKKGLYYELVIAQSEKEKEKAKAKELDSDKEDELEEELVRKANEVAKTKASESSRRMSIMLRRSSIVSAKSISSEISESGNDAQIIDEKEKEPLFRMPFLVKVTRLNAPEWYYLLIGGIASLAVGAVMPV